MCDILFVFEIHSITKLTLGFHSKDFEILDACDHCVILSTGNRKWEQCREQWWAVAWSASALGRQFWFIFFWYILVSVTWPPILIYPNLSVSGQNHHVHSLSLMGYNPTLKTCLTRTCWQASKPCWFKSLTHPLSHQFSSLDLVALLKKIHILNRVDLAFFWIYFPIAAICCLFPCHYSALTYWWFNNRDSNVLFESVIQRVSSSKSWKVEKSVSPLAKPLPHQKPISLMREWLLPLHLSLPFSSEGMVA